MRKGKMCSQAAHASVSSVVGNMGSAKVTNWLEQGMAKIVVGCESEDELFQLLNLAKDKDCITSLIQDAGRTEFKTPTYTCIAIGPEEDYKINDITRNLKLL